jgi:5-methylcytosine-specific restriction enzyme A
MMAKIQMLRTGVKPLHSEKAKPVQATKRITGNSLYALMRRFETHNPRICAECKRKGFVSYGDELDHITPLHLGGSNGVQNLQWLCRACHAEKSEAEGQDRAGGISKVKKTS